MSQSMPFRCKTLIFGIVLGGTYRYPMKNCQRTAKFFLNWGVGVMSEVLSGPLTDLSAWLGFCTSRPQQGIKYQLWYLGFFGGKAGGGEGAINIPWKIAEGRQSSFSLGLRSNVLPGPLTDLSAWVGFSTSSPQQGVKYQLWYLDFGGDPIDIPWKIAKGRQSAFSLGV